MKITFVGLHPELTRCGHQLCSCHPTTTPAYPQPRPHGPIQKVNPGEDPNSPGSLEDAPHSR